jgi:hypothetical protein
MDLFDFLIALPFLWYLGVPLLIKSTMKIHARPGAQPVTPRYLPDDVKDYLDDVGPKLSSLGFEPVACFVMENPATPNVTPHVQLWVNRRTGQMASANVFVVKHPGDKPTEIKTHVEFVTKLSNGPAIATNNAADLGAFKKTSACDTLSATRLKEVAHLHRLHTWREGKLGAAPGVERFVPAPGAELAWFADAYEDSIVRQVGTGYLQVVAGETTIYQPTLRGAYMMTWGQMWPMKGLRRSAEDRRAEEQVRQCAAAGNVTVPPTVRVTNNPPQRGPQHRKAA